MIGLTLGEWIQGAICVGFPGWVMLVMMLLIKFVKKPADLRHPDHQHGFPIAPKHQKDSKKQPME